ncbi:MULTISPECIES: aldehyde dehydrogenase [Rhodococcus]|uniref:Aldehyde dehydrogenase n=1 Tax=Rhodococcus aetherivorans TaxID=191292 RepID=N1M8Z2_9NOCA|nr:MULTISPECIES: aldehyde dehydrogenase [Rhodococcus]KDE11744.1 aldehyde dehydrogenase [Rhodococcus aetherivorans]MDV6294079.1 aldehyde dehydrogenase [Rhodococcus aetherivorans]PND49302.1 aldehyde dehydrogenase [Rhodococcus sp. ENV425]QRI77815.1 aldehyde dehydrogenase [Rhodococcus aetherivorans]QSE61231.1 aldehyde dehydrogenase [Rhodococcus sp. PSBB066]
MTALTGTTDYQQFYIDGSWADPSSSRTVEVRAAATEERLGSVPEASERDIDDAVAAARRAFDDPRGWSRWDPARRREALERFAVALEKRAPETATRVSSQNGMPIWLAQQFEGGFPALLLRYYSGLVADTPQEETRQGMLGGKARVIREPIGVVGAIVPWNVPQGITFLKLAPALAAGCTVVLKPAPETVLDAMLMAEAAAEAQLPAGVLNVVPGGGEIGAYLVAHPQVDKVSFTGSTAAGRTIAETCGRLLRPVTLELGGKSAAIVLDDADLASTIESFFASTLLNNGQICWLSTRVLAPRSRYAEVVDTVSGLVSSLRIGDPLAETTQIGPLVSARQRDRVESYIAKGKAEGARLTAGGGRPAGLDHGWYVQPTVFAEVDNNHTIAQEEIFGPVLSVIPYTDEDEAVAIANASDYGLGGSVWTTDPERGEAVARRVRTGSIGINAYVNDPVAPFGGIKASGIGRELGPEALHSYQVLKTIYLDASAAQA